MHVTTLIILTSTYTIKSDGDEEQRAVSYAVYFGQIKVKQMSGIRFILTSLQQENVVDQAVERKTKSPTTFCALRISQQLLYLKVRIKIFELLKMWHTDDTLHE